MSAWISVELRKPEHNMNVLFFVQGYTMDWTPYSYMSTGSLRRYEGEDADFRSSSGTKLHASHWMPLPEPPK